MWIFDFSKDQWITIGKFAIQTSGVAIAIIIFFYKTIKNFFEKRAKFYENIDGKFNEVKSLLNKDIEGTKACLYNDLDILLTKAEVTGVWSSQIKKAYEEMFKRYLELGNGLDDGKTLKARAENIETNDVKYHELMAKYNKYKQDIFKGGM